MDEKTNIPAWQIGHIHVYFNSPKERRTSNTPICLWFYILTPSKNTNKQITLATNQNVLELPKTNEW